MFFDIVRKPGNVNELWRSAEQGSGSDQTKTFIPISTTDGQCRRGIADITFDVSIYSQKLKRIQDFQSNVICLSGKPTA